MELPESTFLGADDFLECDSLSELGHIADGRFDKYVRILKYRFENLSGEYAVLLPVVQFLRRRNAATK
eukprot:scaffold3594_cov138-Cylindrotheca_fusiformis.AAC.2